jgi:4-hydroxybenzoate polyprenyltransferase
MQLHAALCGDLVENHPSLGIERHGTSTSMRRTADVRLPLLRESTPGTASPRSPIERAIDALLFSGAWVALAAASLTTASFRVFGAAPQPPVVALAFLGTLAVYAIDRLRDLDRDRVTAPLRSTFVEQHRNALIAIAITSAIASVSCATSAGPRAIVISAVVLAIGLLHRRLKRLSMVKPIYLVSAWLAVVVALPAAIVPSAPNAGLAALVLAPALFANVAASRSLRVARSLALLGVALAWVAPSAVRPLGAVALATGVALLRFRRTEHYSLGILDGALTIGALASLMV